MSGDAWVELDKPDELVENIFAFEMWFSIEESEEIQTIISIIDENENIKFGLFTNPLDNYQIQIRYENTLHDIITLNENLYNDSFYYLAIISDEISRIYINGELVSLIESTINLDNNIISIGAKTNRIHTINENYLYGYIDEIRLWTTTLSDDFIGFHYENFTKISQTSDTEELSYLSGLWRFNNTTQSTSYIIQDETCSATKILYDDHVCLSDNDATIYTVGLGRVEYSDKHK